MFICSVCKNENDQFATICSKCGSYLQNQVQNLDLFRTIWHIIEDPRKAFKLIAMSQHKNYAVLLFILFGIRIAFFVLSYYKFGEQFDNVFSIIFWALLIGVPLGFVLGFLITSLNMVLSKLLSGTSSFRGSLGISSYALTPIIISLIISLPIQLMTFGMFLFTSNPHPLTIMPVSFLILNGFDCILALWAFLLSIFGMHVGFQFSFWKSFFVTLISYSMLLAIIDISCKYIFLI